MHEALFEILLCPRCRSGLSWSIGERDGAKITMGAGADCATCGATYHIRDGVGAFLTPDLQRTDLWEESHGSLTRYLNEHPDAKARLIDGPLDDLEPVDRFLRSEYLEDLGDFAGAENARRGTGQHLYTPEMIAVMDECTACLVDLIPENDLPVVDVASGRGTLLEPMVQRELPFVVSTDFSARILRRNRRRLQQRGITDSISYLVMDARKTPFRDRSVPCLVSHMGLANILDGASDALLELRRICSGSFLFTHAFCKPDDPVHAPMLRRHGYPLAFLEDGLQALSRAGWAVDIIIQKRVPVRPTPSSTIVPEAAIDAFPLDDTEFDYALLRAR